MNEVMKSFSSAMVGVQVGHSGGRLGRGGRSTTSPVTCYLWHNHLSHRKESKQAGDRGSCICTQYGSSRYLLLPSPRSMDLANLRCRTSAGIGTADCRDPSRYVPAMFRDSTFFHLFKFWRWKLTRTWAYVDFAAVREEKQRNDWLHGSLSGAWAVWTGLHVRVEDAIRP